MQIFDRLFNVEGTFSVLTFYAYFYSTIIQKLNLLWENEQRKWTTNISVESFEDISAICGIFWTFIQMNF